MNAAAVMLAIIRKSVALAAENVGIRSKRIGTIGSLARRSQATKPAIRTAARTSAPITWGLPQPTLLVLTRPQASATAPMVAIATPGRSSLAAGPRLSGSREIESPAAARPIGTLSQKI